MKLLLNIYLLFTVSFFNFVLADVDKEEGRVIVYSNGGIFKFIMAWAIPVEVPLSVAYAHNIQFQFPAIDTAEKLYDLLKAGYARNNRNFLYRTIYTFLYRNNLAECLPKFICQVSEAPLGHNGLLAELIETVFRPDKNSENRFIEAWESGKNGADCHELYSGCIYPLMDSFSTIKYMR